MLAFLPWKKFLQAPYIWQIFLPEQLVTQILRSRKSSATPVLRRTHRDQHRVAYGYGTIEMNNNAALSAKKEWPRTAVRLSQSRYPAISKNINSKQYIKVKGHVDGTPISRATECHLPYGITQCYLPPDTQVNTFIHSFLAWTTMSA